MRNRTAAAKERSAPSLREQASAPGVRESLELETLAGARGRRTGSSLTTGGRVVQRRRDRYVLCRALVRDNIISCTVKAQHELLKMTLQTGTATGDDSFVQSTLNTTEALYVGRMH